MNAVAFCVLLQASLVGADAQPYGEAYKQAQASDQPLVVLIGTDWCPGCITMKRSVIPGLVRRGALRGVQFTTVDADDNPGLARKLMRGNSIPQLIVFSRSTEGWQRQQFTGPRGEADIQAAIQRAVEAQARAPKLATDTN